MKVKDICNLQNGRAFKPSDWGTEGLPIIRIQNLNDVNAPFNYYAGEYNPVHEINDGELLFSWSGTPGTSFGAFRWYRGKGVLNQHIFRVIPKKTVDKEYLKYALNGNIATIIAKAHGGVGLQHITKKELDEIDIPIVSECKQQEIIDVLQRAEKIINLRKYELVRFDELIKARFVEMFGEQFKGLLIKVGDLADVYIGLTYKPENVSEKGTIVLRSGNIQNQSLQVETDVVRVSGVKIAENKYVKDKDILMCARNGSARLVGKSCLIRNPKEEMAFGAFMSVIRTEYPYFLQGFFSSDYFKNQLTNVGTTSVNQITSKMLNEYNVILPTKKQEEEFSVFCDQVDKSKLS